MSDTPTSLLVEACGLLAEASEKLGHDHSDQTRCTGCTFAHTALALMERTKHVRVRKPRELTKVARKPRTRHSLPYNDDVTLPKSPPSAKEDLAYRQPHLDGGDSDADEAPF